MHALVTKAANAIADRRWRRLGARSAAEVRSWVVAAMRRRLGLHVAREMARHRLSRLPYVGATHAAVRARGRRGELRPGGGDTGGVRADDFYAFQAQLMLPPADLAGKGWRSLPGSG